MSRHDPEKLSLVNQVLSTFIHDSKYLKEIKLEFREGYYFVWELQDGRQRSKKWITKKGSFYPSCTDSIPLGGTMTQAISQLVRYCQGRAVLPLSTWCYWGSDSIKLWQDPTARDKAISLLEESDYPKSPICIFCGNEILNGFDWYYLPPKMEGCGHWGKSCQKQQASSTTVE